MATAAIEGVKYTADVDSLYFPDSESNSPGEIRGCSRQCINSSIPVLSDLNNIDIKLVKDNMEHSEYLNISDDSLSEWDNEYSESDTCDPHQRRPRVKRNRKTEHDNDSDDTDDLDQDNLDEDHLHEDYILAMELDREMNGDIDRLEQLLWNLDEEFPTAEEEPEPLYPVGPSLTTECQICLVEKFLHKRTCCQYPVCEECLIMYFEFQINQANVKISCPHCKLFVYKTEIFDKISTEMQKKFYQFIVDANKDPLKKTCPRCSAVHSIEEWQRKDKHVKKYGLKIDCEECHFEWCFQCQSPLHPNMKCKDYQKGEKLVKEWASKVHGEQANARRCPKCKIWIQRSTGCDHMTCNQCNAQFCYRCGGRYFSVKFIGSHHNRWSILGCRNNFMSERPVSRRLVRGTVFAGQIVGGLVLGSLALAAAGTLAGVAVIALPIYGSVRLHRKIKQQKRLKKLTQQRREAQERYQQRVIDLKSRGDPYLEQWNRNQNLRLRERTPARSPSYPRKLEISDLSRSSRMSDETTASEILAACGSKLDSVHPEEQDDEAWDSESDQENECSRPSIHTSMAEIHSNTELSYEDTQVNNCDPTVADAESDTDTVEKRDSQSPETPDVKRIHRAYIDCVITL